MASRRGGQADFRWKRFIKIDCINLFLKFSLARSNENLRFVNPAFGVIPTTTVQGPSPRRIANPSFDVGLGIEVFGAEDCRVSCVQCALF